MSNLRATTLPAAIALIVALGVHAAPTATAPPEPDPMNNNEAPMKSTQSATQSSDTAKSTDLNMKVSLQTRFDTFDVNHDGYIDKQEAAIDKQLLSQFDKLDANKDSKLSIAEFANAKGLALTNKTNKDEEARH